MARTGELGESEPPCAAGATTLVCLDAGVTGYDLATGEELWQSADPAQAVTILDEWAYLYRDPGHDGVLDARTGEVLAADAELPDIRFADEHGVLLGGDDGYTWAPFPR
jgi:outer membrane protein assembly factor BamB